MHSSLLLGTIKDMIKKTIFSVSTSERNPVHTGVKFEITDGKIVLVAVDDARLAIRRESVDFLYENEEASGKTLEFVVPAKTLNEIITEFCNGYYGSLASPYILEYIYLWENHVKDYDLWLYDDADNEMFNDELVTKSLELLNKALSLANNNIYKQRIEKLLLGPTYLYLVRLDMDYPNRNELIDEFKEKLLSLRITFASCVSTATILSSL